MPASVNEWSDQHWDRTFARPTSQVDTAKLLVTFALGISAAIVATALQIEPQNGLDMWACIVLAVAFVCTIAAIILDRLKWPSRRRVMEKKQDQNWNDDQLLAYIRLLLRDTEDENERVVRHVQCAAEYQVIMSGLAGTLAVVSLFQ